MELYALQTTLLKNSTAQSSAPNVRKHPIEKGKTVSIRSWKPAPTNHLEVQTELLLDDRELRPGEVANPGTDKWFAFAPHFEIRDKGAMVSVEQPDPETAPQVNARVEPDETPLAEPGRKARLIQIRGYGSVNLYDPIPGCQNFYWYEATHNGSRIPDRDQAIAIIRMAEGLQRVRNQLKNPIIVTSWFRPEPFNRSAGGARNSQHLSGGAVDIKILGMTGAEIRKEIDWWRGGLGTYRNLPRICHLDVRGYRARW